MFEIETTEIEDEAIDIIKERQFYDLDAAIDRACKSTKKSREELFYDLLTGNHVHMEWNDEAFIDIDDLLNRFEGCRAINLVDAYRGN